MEFQTSANYCSVIKYLEDDHATKGCVLEYAKATLATAAMTSRCMKARNVYVIFGPPVDVG
jgi:hypothetical protein